MSSRKVFVIGAGIVGICCAVNLRRRGFCVYLMDRKEPAQETSYGNSGVIANSYFLPLARPGLLKKLPSMLLNRDPKFRLHYPHLPLLAPWLRRFITYCNQHIMEQRIPILAHLLSDVIEDHVELMRQSSAHRYLNDNGWLRLYTDQQSYDASAVERENYDRFEVSYQVLDDPQIRELEPDLTAHYDRGVWLDRLPSVRNPGAVCAAYAELFRSLGGVVLREEVGQLSRNTRGWTVRSSIKDHHADQVVISLGAWSPELLGITWLHNPIAIERGYHLMFEPAAGKTLTRCIMDVDHGFVMTPMETGIRATTATNLIARETRPAYAQINDLVPKMRATFPLGRQLMEEPWFGHRPSTPDSLPIIGPSQQHPDLWYAFGHGHLGFTLGPTTGKIIGAAVAGEPWDPRNDPFLPARFTMNEKVS